MKETFLKLQIQFQKYWQNLSVVQKVTVTFLVVVIFVSLIGFTFWATKPEYSVLFTNLGSQDASSIIVKLKEMKIPYRLGSEGSAISVPTREVYELRLSLAGQGIPQGGGVGYEVFDRSFFGMTEFTQQLNFQRALQGELERTIREIAGVQGVRVHLVIPQEELFIEEEKESTASVLLKLSAGTRISKSQVRAIVNLVRTSVEGLKDENVSIIDTNGNILSDVLEEEINLSGAVSDVFQMKKKIERDIQQEVKFLLERIIGTGKVAVKANVELKLTREETTQEEYIPVVDEKEGVVRSEQKKVEYFKGSQEQNSGVPGVSSNISSVPGYAQGGAGGGSSDYTKEETVVNYEINKKLSHIMSIPGEITRITISVLLDSDLSEEVKATLRQVVSSAIGIEAARGDEVVVENFQFDRSYLEEEQKEKERMEHIEFRNLLIKSGVVGMISLLVLLFTLSMIRHGRLMRTARRTIQQSQQTMPSPETAPVSAEPALATAAVQSLYGGAAVEQGEEIKKQIEEIAHDDPEKLAKVIKDILSGS